MIYFYFELFYQHEREQLQLHTYYVAPEESFVQPCFSVIIENADIDSNCSLNCVLFIFFGVERSMDTYSFGGNPLNSAFRA